MWSLVTVSVSVSLSWSMHLSSSVFPVPSWVLSLVVCVVSSSLFLPSPPPLELSVVVCRFVWPVVDEPVGRQGDWAVWIGWVGWVGWV